MSKELTVLNNNPQAIQLAGVGIGEGLFRARPTILEMVHKSSRQDNVIPGQFRVTATNEHLGESIRVVLLAVPQEQREWYIDPTVFSKDNKGCFSLDNKQPHDKAAQPPALYCATCPKGDINWATWRKTKLTKDLPACQMYYHLFIADRVSQTPYYLNIKGASVTPFRQAMETQMAGLLAKLVSNVKAENKKRGYILNPSTGVFDVMPGFVGPEGSAQEPQVPMPNIFDVSFTIYTTQKVKGGPFVMGFKDFKLMSPEDKAEFGAMYLDFATRKAQAMASQAEAEPTEEEQANEAVSEGGPVTGEVVGKEEPITI